MTIDQQADEAAIHALFERQAKAWHDGDAAAFASVYAEDADYVTWFGTHSTGREEIHETHVPLFEKYLKNTRLDGEITGFRFLTPDVALVHGKGAVLKGRRRRTLRNTKVQSTVVVRTKGGWQIAAFHNTKYHWLLAKFVSAADQRRKSSTAVG
ncbi:SgcJ/EcaC family oxidoreductase [Nocardia altamirensis]|uniref:SgcJ/EcaC family oxidoreductase n=1 Tax=Nocardia altamirensis TaxID=472158 RepID=UPI0008405791|nr:SgcJ/EcaC family oxidoreductase [Nocardia altamirensis]